MSPEKIKIKCLKFALKMWPEQRPELTVQELAKELFDWVMAFKNYEGKPVSLTNRGKFTTTVDTESGGLVLSSLKTDKQ